MELGATDCRAPALHRRAAAISIGAVATGLAPRRSWSRFARPDVKGSWTMIRYRMGQRLNTAGFHSWKLMIRRTVCSHSYTTLFVVLAEPKLPRVSSFRLVFAVAACNPQFLKSEAVP